MSQRHNGHNKGSLGIYGITCKALHLHQWYLKGECVSSSLWYTNRHVPGTMTFFFLKCPGVTHSAKVGIYLFSLHLFGYRQVMSATPCQVLINSYDLNCEGIERYMHPHFILLFISVYTYLLYIVLGLETRRGFAKAKSWQINKLGEDKYGSFNLLPRPKVYLAPSPSTHSSLSTYHHFTNYN